MVLVSGARGFVGRSLLKAFEKAGRSPRTLDADIMDVDAVRAETAERQASTLIHLAALSSVAMAETGAADNWRVNVGGAVNAAEALWDRAPAGTVVFASSAEVYGAAFGQGRVVDENVEPRPLTVYGRTKLAAEAALADLRPPAGRLVILRMFNQIGPGQDERFALASFAAQIARIERGLQTATLQTGDLSAIRDFIDVRDGVNAYLDALDAAPGEGVTTLNICSGIGRNISGLLDRLIAMSTTDVLVELDESRLRSGGIAHAVGSCRKLGALTGWAPRIPMDKTLADILDDARQRVVA